MTQTRLEFVICGLGFLPELKSPVFNQTGCFVGQPLG
jgi:hypothetical protein